MSHQPPQVYIGLSGGVDSAVSAALLVQQGYKVVGVYMQNWTQDVGGVECPWRQDLADARAVGACLGIQVKVYDFQEEYRQAVVDTMVAEYQAGRTPNPDVLCNQFIKFKLFAETARADGADLIATGHYARTQDGHLLQAADAAKDQTYFLYRVNQEVLRYTLFPLGNLTKPEVRALATKLRLPNAAKPDSQGICFVGQVGIREFLSSNIKTTPGPIIETATGQVVGQHSGAIFYTIGQRHGLGVGGGRPFYVTGKDMAINTVYVTADNADTTLDTTQFAISDCHWIGGQPPAAKSYQIRVRHRGQLVDGHLEPSTKQTYRVTLANPERAVAAGQSAVVYDGDEVLGGGIIQS